MVENGDWPAQIALPGVHVLPDRGRPVASLRCFDWSGGFSKTVQTLLGMAPPGPLCAAVKFPFAGADGTILAWRSPTETLLLCDDAALIGQLESAAACLEDGCVVDQTGGACVLRASGEGIADLFARLGGQGTLPRLGEARSSRLGEVPVLALQVRPGEVQLIVERAYREHLMAWIRGGRCAMPGSPT